MKNLKLNITQFRHLNNLSLDLGSPISVIPVGNVTGNIYLLGLVVHIFRFDNFLKNIFNDRFEIKYSSVFRFSFNHHTVGKYQHKLQISDNSEKEVQLRLTTEYDRSRHRIDVVGSVRHGCNINKSVILHSLKRVLPLAQENERNIQIGFQKITATQTTEYSNLYSEFISTFDGLNNKVSKRRSKN